MVNVYADMLFGLNFIINLILLKISTVFIKTPAKTWRLCISSIIGSVYALGMFFPKLAIFYTFPFKIAVSALMLKFISPHCKFVQLIKHTLVFYLVVFTFAGVLISLSGLGYFSKLTKPIISGGIFYFDISLATLVLSSLLAYSIIYLSLAIFKRNKTIGLKKLKICLSGKECEMTALSDTGNLLTDPLTGVSVIIAEKRFLDMLFKDGMPTLSELDNTDIRLRLIPYSSLGKNEGMLIGFIPDEVRIDGRKTQRVIVAASPDILSSKDEYNALFNPAILN